MPFKGHSRSSTVVLIKYNHLQQLLSHVR